MGLFYLLYCLSDFPAFRRTNPTPIGSIAFTLLIKSRARKGALAVVLVYAMQKLCAAAKTEIKSSADYAVNEPPDIVPVAIRRSVVRVPIERAVVAAVVRVTADTRGTETGTASHTPKS